MRKEPISVTTSIVLLLTITETIIEHVYTYMVTVTRSVIQNSIISRGSCSNDLFECCFGFVVVFVLVAVNVAKLVKNYKCTFFRRASA